MIRQKEHQIHAILKSQGIVVSSRIGGSDKDQALEMAYHDYCKHLYEIGFTEDLIPPKDTIIEILRSRGMLASTQSGDGNIQDDTNTEDDTNIDDTNTEVEG